MRVVQKEKDRFRAPWLQLLCAAAAAGTQPRGIEVRRMLRRTRLPCSICISGIIPGVKRQIDALPQLTAY
jgi:hypothetical protein